MRVAREIEGLPFALRCSPAAEEDILLVNKKMQRREVKVGDASHPAGTDLKTRQQ